MALRTLAAEQFPEISFSDFMGAGHIGAPVIDASGKLPGRLLETFSPQLRVQIFPLENGSLRREVMSVAPSFVGARVVQDAHSLPLSPWLRGGAQIEVARNFKSASEAASALPFQVMQLPLSAEKALALTEGTYVGIPIEGTIGIGVNGNFLARNERYESKLSPYLHGGSTGRFSGSMQGMLLAKGQWRLQILKLGAHKVRVRVVEDDGLNAQGGVGGSAFANAAFTFVPFGKAARALDISQRVVNNARNRAGQIFDSERFTKEQILRLPEALRKAKEDSAKIPSVANPALEIHQRGKGIPDYALNLANQGTNALENLLDNAVSATLGRVESMVNLKIEAAEGALRRLTNFTFQANAAVHLGGEFGRRYRFVADYVFDLSTPESKMAFEHAVSGRSVWLGEQPSGHNLGVKLGNFAVAERLAAEDSGAEKPRVLRNIVGEGLLRSRALSVHFSGLWMESAFSENWRNNVVWVRDSAGNTASWSGALWQFERTLKAARVGEMERLGSGILAPMATSGGAHEGNYWFAWKRRLAAHNPSGMEMIFADTLNITGPLGFAFGLHNLYGGEFDGEKDASLLMFFSKNALNSFFDASRATPAVLWKALGNVAASFDNTFGLPYNTFGALPPEYAQIPEAVEACGVVSKNWGGAYCQFFGSEFLPKLASLRANPSAWERMKVFESFYSKGFLANKIGAKLLARYVAEVVTLVQGANATKEIVVHFSIRNAQDSSAYASPVFVSGAPDELQVLEALGML
jgi:hypothetical protein